MKKLAIVAALSAAGMFTIASAHYEGYAVDSNDRLVRDSFGNCVKTGTWTKEKAIPECDPKLVRKIDETPRNTGTIPRPAVVDQPAKVEAAPVIKPVPAAAPVVAEEPKAGPVVAEEPKAAPVTAAPAAPVADQAPMVFPITRQDPVNFVEEDTTLVAADAEAVEVDEGPLADTDDPAPVVIAATPAATPAPDAKPAPVAAAEPKEAVARSTSSTTVYFNFNRSSLTQKAKRDLASFADAVRGTDHGVRVLAYTDPLGSKAYNKKLSKRRAQSVERFLAKNGVKTIKTEGNGILEVNVQECGKMKRKSKIACYKENRRANLFVF